MTVRTALLISCSQEQAATIRKRAEFERRTMSGYVLRIVVRWLDLEDRLLVMQREGGRRLSVYQSVRASGRRATILIRCSKDEAQRIRAGAKRRSTTISWYVLNTLSLSWSAGDRTLMAFRNKQITHLGG